jgi:hypothetical protein
MTPEAWKLWFEQLGISERDWTRIRELAMTATSSHQPAALDDLDAPWRIGAVPVEKRKYVSGTQIGIWRGRAILIWPK